MVSEEMLKRYFLTFIFFTLLLVCYGISLLPLLLLSDTLAQKSSSNAFIVWGLLAFISLFPALHYILKRIWFFEGRCEPVPLESLQSVLLNLNSLDAPVLVKEKKKKYIVTWRCKEEKWCQLMEHGGVKKLYELHLFFDNPTKTVFFKDISRSINFITCPAKVKVSFLRMSKPLLGISLSEENTIDTYGTMDISEYTFCPKEIKTPVLNTVLNQGWNVRFRYL